MEVQQDDESASINRRDPAGVLADYASWLAEQPLSARTREAYLAAVTAFVAWLDRRDAGPGDALGAPRARDLAARDCKRHTCTSGPAGWPAPATPHRRGSAGQARVPAPRNPRGSDRADRRSPVKRSRSPNGWAPENAQAATANADASAQTASKHGRYRATSAAITASRAIASFNRCWSRQLCERGAAARVPRRRSARGGCGSAAEGR